MAKVLKGLLKVVTFAVGVMVAGPLGGFIAVSAVSVASSLLAKKPKAPANSPESYNRLRANIDVRTPRKTVVGRTAFHTDIRDEEFTDNQTYFHRFIVVASHKVHSIEEIWFDAKLAWSSASGVQSEFSGYLQVTPVLEGSAGNAINISSRMGSTRRYTGLAYVYLRYKLTGATSKTESPFAQSITTRITVIGNGAALYDPRLDSTVAGGSGSQRANDQATWAWNDNASRNPALALLFYLLGYRINGELAVGKGIPPERIDLASFAVAANLCDEPVTAIGGGTEPRYRCDGVWSEGDRPTTVIDAIKACINADLDDVDGKLRVTVFHNDLAVPQASFGQADVLGEFEWVPSQPLDQTFNIVRGVYTDPSTTALYQTVDYPEVTYASSDGIERIDTFDLPMVQSAGQAQRLASLRLERQRYGGAFTATFQATAWAVQKNDVIALTFPPRGFVGKLFRVAEMELRTDGAVPLVLREENAAIYGAPALEAPVTPVAPPAFDYTATPIAGAVADLTGQVQGASNGAVYSSFSGSTNSTTMTAVGPTLTLNAGAGGQIALDATYSFTTAQSSGSYNEFAQWYDVTGSPVALGSENPASLPHIPEDPQTGEGYVQHTVTGLTPGSSHSYRLYMRNTLGTAIRSINGNLAAVPS